MRFWGRPITADKVRAIPLPPAIPAGWPETLEDALRDQRYLATKLGPDVAEFFAYMELQGRSPHTIKSYRYALALGCMLYPAHGIGEITHTHLANVLMQVPAGSRHATKSAWSSFYAWAFNEDKVAAKPTDRLPELKRKGRRNHEIFSDAEVDRLIALPVLDGALMALLLEGGLRVGEAVGMRGRDIDFDAGEVRVTGKGDKDRTVPLPERALMRLAELYTLEGIGPDDHLWYATKGHRLATGIITRTNAVSPKGTFHDWWVRTLAAARVEYRPRSASDKGRGNPHTTRHTYAMRFLRGKVGLAAHEIPSEDERARGAMELLQLALGHSSIATTEAEYGHLETSDVRLALRRMARSAVAA